MNELTTTNNAQVPSRYVEADIREEMKILRAAFPKLDAGDEQLRALVIASKWSGLNPFRGEIYYIPKVGITVATKIRAGDAVTHQARNGNTLDIKFEHVTLALVKLAGSVYSQFEGAFNEGDVCYSCRIVSSKQRREHYNWRIQLADEGRAYGYKGFELETWVNEKAGPAPEVIALGVVRKDENFGGDAKYSRADRAMKRALTLALNRGGWASPDTRNYGGVAIEEERQDRHAAVDADFREVKPDIPNKPRVTMPEQEWDADLAEAEHGQPPLVLKVEKANQSQPMTVADAIPPAQPSAPQNGKHGNAEASADLDWLNSTRVNADNRASVMATWQILADRYEYTPDRTATPQARIDGLRKHLEAKLVAQPG